MIEDDKDQLIGKKKDYVAALSLIQQGLDETILPQIAATTKSKEVRILKWHQVKGGETSINIKVIEHSSC